MTSNEVDVLKAWMEDRFARSDERIATLEAHARSTDQSMARVQEAMTMLEAKLDGIDSVVERLELIVKPIEDLATLVNRGKVWRGEVVAVLVALDLLARVIPRLAWPF